MKGLFVRGITLIVSRIVEFLLVLDSFLDEYSYKNTINLKVLQEIQKRTSLNYKTEALQFKKIKYYSAK